MKKSLSMVFIATSILVACNHSNIEENNNPIAENEQVEETEVEQAEIDSEIEQDEAETAEKAEQEKSKADSEENDQSEKSLGMDLPEYEKVSSTIDIDDYYVQKVTDNEGERIFLYIDENGKKQYKSIFIKHDDRLKIIQLNGGGQIFNEIIG